MDQRQIIVFFWRHAWQYKGLVIGLTIATCTAIIFYSFLPPLILAHVIDRINASDFVRGDLWGSFGGDIALFAAVSSFGGVLAWRTAVIFDYKLEMNVVRDINQEVFDHLIDIDANFHANHFGGSLVSQANRLTSAYIRLADVVIYGLSGLVLSFVLTFIILAPREPWFVTALFVFSILFMISAVAVTKKVREYNAREAAASNKQTGVLADVITNIMALKSFAARSFERKRYQEYNEATRAMTRQTMIASTKRDTYFAIATGTLTIGSLILALGSIVTNVSSIGTMFLIITYSAMISQRLWDFSQGTLRNYNRALADAKEMIGILDTPHAVKDALSPESLRITRGAISFDKVLFTHADASEDSALFRDFSLHIKAGEKIGLVGHSGSGKTTLTRLLLRFSDIDGGVITIDGQDISRITQHDLRRSIAYIPQEPLLFHRSLRENIAYGKPTATQAEIIAAAKQAHALEFIERLPQGLETLVGERGVKLSGGQRQRIAIARAIIKDAPILVLDEATSALDSESERLIQASLSQLMAERTAIVIAHRLSTIQKMDRIVVLENGQIIEDGSHQGLLQKANGAYASMWAHQSGGFIEE